LIIHLIIQTILLWLFVMKRGEVPLAAP